MPACAVVVVNWNGAAYLPACLSALAAQTYRDFAVWAVDNGSADGSDALLAQAASGAWPRVATAYSPEPSAGAPPPLHFTALARNTGFSAGNNTGFRAALADPGVRYVVPLNNDTVAAPGWLAALVAAAEADSRIGSVASTLVFAAHPTRVASAGITAHRDGLMLDRGVGWDVATLPGTPQPIFGASAGAALYRREVLEDAGFFDPAFFSYLEDADLAWRARLRGWGAVWAPGAVVRHVVSATGGQGSPFKNYHLARNRLWCILKNWPASLLARDCGAIARYDALAVLYGLARGDRALVAGRRAALRALPRVRAQRQAIQARRMVSTPEVARWLAPALSVGAAVAARRAVDALLATP